MPNRVRLAPPPTNIQSNSRSWTDWLSTLHRRVGEGPFLIKGYSVSNLPDATEWGSVSSDNPFSSIIFVYDESSGSTLAYSDGTDWRSVATLSIVA